ncbi:winged helix-turn-helix domain-containing protein (plasmid) [Myxococcus sp. MxC21-1]|uniref:winged helix-turn-helix domain-containing protein n=1 Tax=Myxococcus sp. MxC21-1 TaxID=3041439 RepID=UPI00292F90A3|nr:winged helix-turn-helix domain-containing protein [Myxococcus sp. MxC21-1]WNZ66232.1 winged helix-turn-helix domain-containing protein [Myxococcus sp. MxC21-1]
MEPSAFRDGFWARMPPLPEGVTLLRQDVLVIPQKGGKGYAIFDVAELAAGDVRVPVVIMCKARVRPVDVGRCSSALRKADEVLRSRTSAGGDIPRPRIPMLATDFASPAVLEACEREKIALVDQRGAVLLRAASAFVHVEGQLRRRPPRPREVVLRGMGSRLVRVLLQQPRGASTVSALAQATGLSAPQVQQLVRRLVADGDLLPAGRGEYRLSSPPDLLRAWIASERTARAVRIEAFNAPSTTPEALQSAFERLQALGVRAVYTLASALLPQERFVTGLPHGMYLSGAVEPVVTALRLRRLMPHNFWVLRAEPIVETSAGGIYFAPRLLPHGEGVALPQLAVDCSRAGGRGPEQADALVQQYAEAGGSPSSES